MFMRLLSNVFFQHVNSQVSIIKDVTIIDVKKGKALPGQSVIINNERIEAIGPAKKLKEPANAMVIDGAGKFLMPGMIDAHIHFFQSGSLYTRPDAVDLRKKSALRKRKSVWTQQRYRLYAPLSAAGYYFGDRCRRTIGKLYDS